MRFTLRRLVAALAVLPLALQPMQPLLAANHPDSAVVDVNVLNLTANVDWDYDAVTPTQAGSGGIVVTKAVLRNQILREVARSVFLMTEGRHRIGTVYLYKNSRHGKNVDIQIINRSDRSYASAAAWQKAEGSSFNFLAMDGKAESLRNYSRVIAHELGHYVYGFADEYREDGKAPSSDSSGSPAGADITRNSIMNDHETYTRLSLADDYASPSAAANNTAQARVYATDRVNLRGGSQWEVLVRNPANDPTEARNFHNGDRTWFEAFRNVTPPATVSALTRYFGVYCDPSLVASAACGGSNPKGDQVVPATDRLTTAAAVDAGLYAKSGGSNGADAVDGTPGTAFANFNVVFVDSPNPTSIASAPLPTVQAFGAGRPTMGRLSTTAAANSALVERHVIVLDRTLPPAAFDEARQVAEALLELARSGTQWAVVASPSAGAAPAALTPIDTGRATLVASVQAMTRVDGSFDAAGSAATARALLANGRGLADSATIQLITARGTTVPASIGTAARQARTAVNAIALQLANGATGSTTSGGVSLATIAEATGGHAAVARNAEQAIKQALRADRRGSGEVFGVLATDLRDTLPAGTTSTAMTVTAHDKVLGVHGNFDPADKAKLSFRLVTPAGTYSTLSPDSDLDDGYALIEVDNADGRHSGAARAEVVAASAVQNPVGIDVQAESEVELIVDLDGGSLADDRKPVLRARFTGNAPIAGAQVLATVYRQSDGVAVLIDVPMLDDGVAPDTRAGDGGYTLSLADRLPPGDYTFVVRAVTTSGSTFNPNQVFARGSEVSTVPTGAGLTRTDELEATLEVGALGVQPVASPTTADGGGGCTTVGGQRDAGLPVLLGVALLGAWMRRRSRVRA